jgi:ABC-2 type transport system permease protein
MDMTVSPLNTQNALRQPLSRGAAAAWHFGMALLQGQLKQPRALLTTLLTPIFLLSMFWMVSGGGDREKFDPLGMMFPAIVGFTVFFSGQPMATKMTSWQQMGVFQRLACTPVPVGILLIGAIVAQALFTMVQALSVLLFGVFVIGLPINALGTLVAFSVLAVGALCFITYSLFIASLVKRPETAGTIFTFTVMPMFFLGGGFPSELLPAALQQISPWLPTTMVNALLAPLMSSGTFPADGWLQMVGLLAYTLLFAALAARFFRWER